MLGGKRGLTMGGTIRQQSPMNGTFAAVGRFLSVLDGTLAGAADEIDAFRSELHRNEPRRRPDVAGKPDGEPFGLPVCRWWKTALGADPAMHTLGQALRILGPRLLWVQNPNYRRSPPEPGWLDNYGYAVIAGPEDGPPALARHDGLAIGVLLLGPHVHYPLHAHPAREIYIPLGVAEWWRNAGPWRAQPPGAVIYHPSGTRHATRTQDSPLLAVYLWMGDLAIHARLVKPPAPEGGSV